MKFYTFPDGSIRAGPILLPQVFELAVAAFNLLESQDQYALDIIDRLTIPEATNQYILDLVISKLEDLSAEELMEAPVEFPEGIEPLQIKCELIE